MRTRLPGLATPALLLAVALAGHVCDFECVGAHAAKWADVSICAFRAPDRDRIRAPRGIHPAPQPVRPSDEVLLRNLETADQAKFAYQTLLTEHQERVKQLKALVDRDASQLPKNHDLNLAISLLREIGGLEALPVLIRRIDYRDALDLIRPRRYVCAEEVKTYGMLGAYQVLEYLDDTPVSNVGNVAIELYANVVIQAHRRFGEKKYDAALELTNNFSEPDWDDDPAESNIRRLILRIGELRSLAGDK